MSEQCEVTQVECVADVHRNDTGFQSMSGMQQIECDTVQEHLLDVSEIMQDAEGLSGVLLGLRQEPPKQNKQEATKQKEGNKSERATVSPVEPPSTTNVVEAMELETGSPQFKDKMVEVGKWLAYKAGSREEAARISLSRFGHCQRTTKWISRAYVLYWAYRLWKAVNMWLAPLVKTVRIPILGPLAALLPKKWGKVLKEISLPLYRIVHVSLVQKNRVGVMLARVHQKWGGARSLWTLSWLTKLKCVQRANNNRIAPTLAKLGIAAALSLWVNSWKETPKFTITRRSYPAYKELLLALKKRALYTSKTPETLAMLRETGIAWLKREENEPLVKDLTGEEVLDLLQAAVVRAMLPDKLERAGMDALLKNGSLLRKFKNINSRGWNTPLDWLVGHRMPKR